MLNNQEPSMPVLIQDLGVQRVSDINMRKRSIGIYKCQCGSEFKCVKTNINNGNTKSCGCRKSNCKKEKHNLIGTRIYRIWVSMRGRVKSKKYDDFNVYMSKNIVVCKEWNESILSFYKWAIENGYDDNLSIDRINNDGNYEPSNCRWVTQRVQNSNTRRIRSNNTSGYRGVHFNKINKNWRTRIQIDKKFIHLGCFKTAIEAAKAYDYYVIDNNLEHTINGI